MREAADEPIDTVKGRPAHRAKDGGSRSHRIKVDPSQGKDAYRRPVWSYRPNIPRNEPLGASLGSVNQAYRADDNKAGNGNRP